MCTHKIRVVNPTKTYKEGSTKHYLEVPCGHCDECNLEKAKDWSLRYWNEIQRYINAGGRVAFVTFTYSPEHLPVRKFWLNDWQEVLVPGFSHQHVDAYNRYIRTYFYQKYGLTGDDSTGNKRTAKVNAQGKEVKSMSLPYKAAWHCEFGTEKSHRSHYHNLFFLPPEMCETKELRSENQAKHFFRKAWKYGFTLYSKEHGLWVNSEFAADYVSKYCFKDYHWFNQPAVHEFLFPDGILDKDHLEMIKDFRPNHWNSKGMGVGLCEIYDDYEKFTEGVDFHFLKYLRKGISIKARPPQYIQRKLIYDQQKDGRYILNEKGKAWLFNSLPEKIRIDVEHLKMDFSPLGIQKHVDTGFIKKHFGHLGITNAIELASYIARILDNRIYFELSYYRYCWQGSFIKSEYKNNVGYPRFFKYLDQLEHDEFVSLSEDKYKQFLAHHDTPDVFCSSGSYFKSLDILLPNEIHSYRYFSECKRFENFDYLLKIQDLLRTEYTRKYTGDYLRDLHNRKFVKSQKYKVS